ncbi:hypothetical protein [Variovorax sp. Varisp62]|uniref:hypothetical protein n=1 Tax=Variovorax sp. Varisp62 TaxID=3243049 RepID=UPI0039B3B9BC
MGSLPLGFISLPAYSFLPPMLRAFTRTTSMKGEKTIVETVAIWRKSDDSPQVKALLSCLPKIRQRGG